MTGCDSSIEIGNFQLQMGRAFEDRRLWEQAEEYYLLAGQAQSLPPASRQLALEGIKRVRDIRMRSDCFSRFVDSCGKVVDTFGAWLLRILVALIILSLVANVVLQFRNLKDGIEISPFSALTDKRLGNQIASSFLKLRSKYLAATIPSPDTFWQIMIPMDPGPLSDLSFEAGGLKFSSLWRLFVRPRFRVMGVGHTAAGSVTLAAQIWRRHYWFGTRLEDSVFADIPVSGNLNVVELETFIYAVFLKILYAPR